MKHEIDVITYGEAMTMFIAEEYGSLEQASKFYKRVAGAELNVATGLSRLGLSTTWMSKIGNDSFGKFILKFLEKENINTELVSIDYLHPTGFQLKEKARFGEDPKVEYFRKGSAASYISTKDIVVPVIEKAKHLHLTGIAPAISLSSFELSEYLQDFMRTHNRTISFDPNLRPSLWENENIMREKINQLAIKSDWFLPGINEGRILTGLSSPSEIADFYLNQGVKLVVIKLGEEGAYFKDKEGNNKIIPPFKVENVVDTVGAGDGFAVGIISALLEGKTIEEAVVRGNKIGSLVIQVSGDNEGLPTKSTLGDY